MESSLIDQITKGDDEKAGKIEEQLKQAEMWNTKSKGADVFYWIAALSMLCSVKTYLFGLGGLSVIELGMARFAYIHSVVTVGPEAMLTGLGIALFIGGIFFLLGYLSHEGNNWAFITGIILYGIDSLFVLIAGDRALFYGVVHGYILICLCSGLKANMRLQKTYAK